MNLNERIDICGKFDEGTEITDAVGSLVQAAHILNGLADYHNAQLALLAAENLITQYVNYSRYESGDYEEYQAIDDEVFKHFTGGARKLTKEEFLGSTPTE